MADYDKIITFFASRKSRGIHNIGATCYIATAIQCLGHCLSFAYPMIANPVDVQRSPISSRLRDLYKVMWIVQQPADPTEFVKALEPKLSDMLDLKSQNDVMEFIMLLLDALNNELGEPCPTQERDKTLRGTNKLIDIMDCHWANSHKLAKSHLADIVYGQTVNQTKCSLCGTLEHAGDLFCSLSLPFDPIYTENNSIDKMIKRHFEHENVTRDCDTCKLRNVATSKVNRIWRTPQVLMVHLQRFNHRNQKITSSVEVPPTIDIDSYVLSNKQSTKYELRAISCHSGNTNYGHYYSIVRNANGTWYLMDDDSEPKELSSYTDVQSHNYYIVFYEVV